YIDNINFYEPNGNDAGVIQILGVYGGFTATANDIISVLVQNYGANNQTNIPVKYVYDNGTVVSETMPSLDAFTTDTFTFVTTFDATTAGSHLIAAYTELANDEDLTNDSSNISFITNSITSVPSTFDFVNTTVPQLQLVQNSGSIAELNSEANNGNSGNGIFMTSSMDSYYTFAQSGVEDAFTNTTQITEANFGVDATSNSNLYMSLDLKTQTPYTNCTWVRVMLNGTTYAKSIDGDSVWKDNTAWQNLTFDLSSVAGTTFEVSIQGALKYSASYSAPGNKVYIDNIKFFEPAQDDLSVTALVSPEGSMCGDAAADVKVIVSNLGLASQSAVPVTAIITTPSGNVTLTGVTGTLAPSGNDTVSLGTVDASAYGVYNVVSYATLATDVTYQDNDTLTTSFEIYTPFAVDYVDGFEGSLNWAATSGWSVSAVHGKSGRGLYKNFYGSGATAAGYVSMTRKIGPIPSGAALSFDYRLIEYSSYPSNALTMDADSFIFMISTDCGASFETIYVIDSLNHVTSTEWAHRQINLSAYVGQDVIIKVEGKRTAGDYYFDLDNYGITRALAGMTPDANACGGGSVDLSAGSSVCSATLLFSSYIEGSSNNKALEIYNATGATINLDDYSIMTNYNGNAWSGQYYFPAGATLAAGDVFVLANNQSDAAILAVADDTLAYNESGYVVGFNGDDVRALFHKVSATDSVMIDIIGRYDMVDPGSGWDVAGVASATKDHTLIRKPNVVVGNTIWDAVAGTDSLSSEYFVYAKNDFSMIGSHTATPYVAPTYLWSTGETTETITVNPTATTTYTVTVSNTNCMSFGSVIVTVNPSPVVNLGNDTTIKWTAGTVTLDAGNPSATWLWNTGTITQTETFDQSNLTNGSANTVYVEVTENGCSSSDTLIITVLDDVSINNTINNVNVSIYPNPSNGQFTLAIKGLEGNFDMTIINLSGQVVYSNNLTATINFSTKVNVRNLARGVYYVKLSNNDGVKTSKLIIK
ncbi:MAG: hypothetical protein DRI86_08325, partial [Bacteroidetes bacterium]